MRVACVVDGFNLYRSLKDAIEDGASPSIKWLDIIKVCQSRLKFFGPDACLGLVTFCTATVGPPQSIRASNQKCYLNVLKAHGVVVKYGHFRNREIRCLKCGQVFMRQVEKQSDVNASMAIIEALHAGYDGCIVVSGDGDIAAAVESAKKMYPSSKIMALQPYGRSVSSMTASAHLLDKLTIKDYEENQYPRSVCDPLTGIHIRNRPKSWD